MANKHANLDALFTDIADAIREKTGDSGTIPAVEFPSMIRNMLDVIPPTYLTFSSPSSFTLAVNDATKHWNGTLEYSTDASTWSIWDGTNTLSSATRGSKYVLYLRGIGNTVITGSNYNYRWVITGSDISCIGNIENLLDYATVESKAHPTMAQYCYSYMFHSCTSITKAPALPATTLSPYCYRNMFQNCNNLIQAPALSATTLADYCYSYMFRDCTSLTQAPALPATTLRDECYSSMFFGCTSLTKAPTLPATTLATHCYNAMFRGCTNLTQAPFLPATTLATYCYDAMFYGCTALTQAPALPATTLAQSCYQSMFSGCTALTKAPALPATTLANYCYYGMFQGCNSLNNAPSLPATILTTSCYYSMFEGCTSLKLSTTQTGYYTKEYRIPSSGTGTTASNALTNMFSNTGGTFTGTPSINTTYYLYNVLVEITDSNIENYFTVTNGTYYFNGNGNVFTTNNKGVNSSTASTTLTAKQNISEISFDYSYSSEKNYDKFTLIVAGSTIENAVSGATTTKSYSGSLTSGQTIEFKYAKDSSANGNNDECTFSNMIIKIG